MNLRLTTSISLLVTLVACSEAPGVSISTPEGQEESGVAFQAPKGTIRDEKHGREIRFGYAAINGIGTTKANGVVTGHQLQDGTAIISIQLNIEPPKDGSFYRAWLEVEGEPLNLGNVTNSSGDARHSLTFEDSLDLPDSARILIKKELMEANNGVAQTVAEGVLKMARR